MLLFKHSRNLIIKSPIRSLSTIDTLKDEVYTIAIIGRPNVGKSTLFNRLMGERLALVDKTPGLTRDRREGITQLFNIPIRLVDTAGFEGTTSDATLQARNLNRQMVNDMLQQTRNALIYADLALFLLDTRTGITQNDVMLYRWLT
jgi:GTPase